MGQKEEGRGRFSAVLSRQLVATGGKLSRQLVATGSKQYYRGQKSARGVSSLGHLAGPLYLVFTSFFPQEEQQRKGPGAD